MFGHFQIFPSACALVGTVPPLYREVRHWHSFTAMTSTPVFHAELISRSNGTKFAVSLNFLLSHITSQLTTATFLAKYLCPTKAVVRTFETAHNYADNTDLYTKVKSMASCNLVPSALYNVFWSIHDTPVRLEPEALHCLVVGVSKSLAISSRRGKSSIYGGHYVDGLEFALNPAEGQRSQSMCFAPMKRCSKHGCSLAAVG